MPAAGAMARARSKDNRLESASYQFSDNLTHMGDSRIGVGLIQSGKQLSEVCHGRCYPASP